MIINKDMIDKKITQYNELEVSKKNIIKIILFFFILMTFVNYTLFKTIDTLNKNKEIKLTLSQEKINLENQKKELLINLSQKSQEHLVQQKNDLQKEVDAILKNNKNISYISAKDVPHFIELFIQDVSPLKLIKFYNITQSDNHQEIKKESFLVKHFFMLEIEGDYNLVYELLNKMKEKQSFHIYSIVMGKKQDVLNTKIEFYIINTEKNVVNLN